MGPLRLFSLVVVAALCTYRVGCDCGGPRDAISACAPAPDAGSDGGAGVRLDPAFADGGIFTLDVDGVDNTEWEPQGMDLDPADRILLGGRGGTAANLDAVALRLREDGTLDPSFGTNGRRTIDFGAAYEMAHTVRVQPDGKIVVAGEADGDSCVARLLPDGAFDPSFATTGFQRLDAGSDFELVNGQVSLPDGRLRLGGQGRSAVGGVNLMVYGLLPNGRLDPAFGTNGLRQIDLFGGDEFGGIPTLDAAGRVLVAGTTYNGTAFDFALARLLDDGGYDSTFSDGSALPGRVSTDFSGDSDGCAVPLVQPDGKILCGGDWSSTGTPSAFAVARYLPSGALDPSFGAGGKATVALTGPGGVFSLVLLGDGRVLCGGAAPNARGDLDFALAMLLPDGSLDPRWGNAGTLLLDVTPGRDDGIQAMKLDSRGRLVVFGSTTDGASTNFAVVRLWL